MSETQHTEMMLPDPGDQPAESVELGGYEVRVDVSVIVPVQSPEAEVREVVRALRGQLERLGQTWEIIFVFDGVDGEAWETVQELHAELGSRIKTILFKNPFGESVCLSAAFERASGDYILTSPQYVQVDPLEVGQMLAGRGLRHPVAPSPGRSDAEPDPVGVLQLGHPSDHSRRVSRPELLLPADSRFLPVMAYRQGFKVVEVRVRHLKEWGKAGFFGIGVYIRRFLDILAVMFLTKFTLKPLRFFGTLGGIFALIGSSISLYMAIERIYYGVGVSGRPLLLLGVLFLVLGVQIIGFGLVGEIIIFSQARNLKEYRIERIYE
ncbi:MAG: glycosyltransferase [Planctomycetota bacterium]|jgi:hypothetical protein